MPFQYNSLGVLNHEYSTNCDLLGSTQGYYATISSLYFVMIVTWTWAVWKKYSYLGEANDL